MIGNDWDEKLKIIWESDGFKKFYSIVNDKYKNSVVFPPQDHIFRALQLTPYSKVKAVIVGQDPYHGEGEAMGLSFSVNDGVALPPSLRNIFKELHDDLGFNAPNNGDLTSWAKEGVLLLNAVLTVEKDKPASHSKLGWELFTDYIIKLINLKDEPVVFILWGNFAKEKAKLITNKNHYVITSVHPSPLSASRGFFGSKPFSKTNDYLVKKKVAPINWQL